MQRVPDAWKPQTLLIAAGALVGFAAAELGAGGTASCFTRQARIWVGAGKPDAAPGTSTRQRFLMGPLDQRGACCWA